MPAVKRPQTRQPRPAQGRGARGPAASPTLVRTLVAGGAVLLVGGGLIAAVSGGRGQAMASTLGDGVGRGFSELGFRVAKVDLRGASPFARKLVLDAVGIEPGKPSLNVDLAALRARIEQVGYVRSATVARMLPDTLVVTVVERNREAVWQAGGRLHVIDDRGQLIPEADPALFPELPMVVGDEANETAHEILPLVQARPRLAKRIEALVRVDGRRWDLRLKDGAIIQLPSAGEDAALIQLDQLDQRSRLLELGFERIDLRDPETVAVRPRGQPAPIPAAYLPKPVEPAAAPAPSGAVASAPASAAPVKVAAAEPERSDDAPAPAKPKVKAKAKALVAQ